MKSFHHFRYRFTNRDILLCACEFHHVVVFKSKKYDARKIKNYKETFDTGTYIQRTDIFFFFEIANCNFIGVSTIESNINT